MNRSDAMINASFWKGRRVFITGHTGFKGTWLCLWLHMLGAKVTGYALNPPTKPSLFELCRVDDLVSSVISDVRDSESLSKAMKIANPEVVIHMAAQPLVRDSYQIPVETYAINVMGTVNLLESVRKTESVRCVINVTTDKCDENKEWAWGYRENEPLGGHDPYSSSKACSELVTMAYRSSFFNSADYNKHSKGIASARAGNVIGGGDWATDRLIPDCIIALLEGREIIIRNPHAIRPWQHVLEPLSGYLLLAQKLVEDGAAFSSAWNFGPHDSDAKPVEWLIREICRRWGEKASYRVDKGWHPHEARYLKLDCSKARTELGWNPKWDLERALESIIKWTRVYQKKGDLRKTCFSQIEAYMDEGA